jgi:ankyrin repeat protein
MRKLACGLLLLAAMSAAPAAAQTPDEAQGVPPGKTRLLFPSKEPWPTLEGARTTSQCEAGDWAQTIAAVKAADPEQHADKQIAAGDFTLKSGTRMVETFVDSRLLDIVPDQTVVTNEPAGVQCKLPVRHVEASAYVETTTGSVIVLRITPSIARTWCGRVFLVLKDDFSIRFNKRVVGHPAYPHKDVCAVVPAHGGRQPAGKVSDRPTPDMIPSNIPDITTAARFGLTEQVAKFIADSAHLAQRDVFGFDALEWSVVRDYRPVFDLIIAAGGNPNFCSALEAAMKYDRGELAILLAQRCTSRLERLVLLELAVARGWIGVVKGLIDTEPALHLSRGADMSAALRKAVAVGHVELVRLLLDHTSVDVWEELRPGLLSMAVARQNAGVIALLLERGTDPGPALALAFRWKAHDAFRALAGRGIDLNKALPLWPHKVRTVDAEFDLLGRRQRPSPRADADPPIFEALHPLMDFKMVDLLLELGASPNVRDAGGRTPLMIAITHSHIYGKKGGASWIERFVPPRLLEGQEDWEHRGVEPVRALLAKGADVALTDLAGLTALHHAARSDYNTEIARLLIAHGADVNVRDKAGKTPLDHALGAGLVRMPDVLAKAGARRSAD